ncbi:MAG: CDP-diacylglycerol--serine O-phosphatidyltransferase [Bacteroidota bacterium]
MFTKIKNSIPNTITSLNLSSGVIAIILASDNKLEYAGLFIIIGAIFDFFDGFAARLLNAKSPIGKDLDSLADVVTFGVAPAFILVQMFVKFDFCQNLVFNRPLVSYLPILFAVFSALRLAKFNIDTRQTENFIGLATPAASLFIAGIAMLNWGDVSNPVSQFLINPVFLIVALLALCFLMVSEIPLFSLKIKNISWKDNYYRYVLLLLSVALLSILQFMAIPLIIVVYIIISLSVYQKLKNN